LQLPYRAGKFALAIHIQTAARKKNARPPDGIFSSLLEQRPVKWNRARFHLIGIRSGGCHGHPPASR
jgi:hypothetical protein